MTTFREAAQQALALIASARLCEVNSMSSRQEMLRLLIEATDTLRAALAAPVQEPVEMQDIGSEWKACVKLPVTVHVRAQRPGETHISTREGITPCRPDDLIMRGVAGEEYPIGRELFKRTYRLGTALEEPQSTHSADCYQWHHKCAIAEVERLRAALEEPVQEPVAWMVYTLDGKSVCVTDNPADFTEQHKALPLYTSDPIYTMLCDLKQKGNSNERS